MSKRTALLLPLLVAWLAGTAPASATTIAVGAHTPSATSPFLVPVEVYDASGLAAFSFDLAYDPTVYAIATTCVPFSDVHCCFVTGPVTPGDFYAGASFPALFEPGFIPLDAQGGQTGALLAVGGAWQDFAASPSGDGVLAYIEFVALADATSAPPIAVVASSVPFAIAEPGTSALFAVALVASLVVVRRPRRRAGRPRVSSSAACA